MSTNKNKKSVYGKVHPGDHYISGKITNKQPTLYLNQDNLRTIITIFLCQIHHTNTAKK